MDITVVVNQVLMLFFPVVIGYVIVKLGIVDSHFTKNLSAFLFNVTLPCAIVSGLQFEFNKEVLLTSGILIFISAAIVVALWAFGIGTSKVFKTGDRKNPLVYSLMFSNFSFMGYPVAQAFMGDVGLFYATMFSLPMYALVQSWGVALIDSEGEKRGFKLSYILNPPMVAVVIGFVLFLTGRRFPASVDGTVRSLGSMTTPLAMVLVGLALSDEPIKNAFKSIKLYFYAALRLVILPLGVFYILKLMRLDMDICRISAVITMMPVAANIIITSAAFGKDASFPARMVLLTTALSVITIPLMGFLIF